MFDEPPRWERILRYYKDTGNTKGYLELEEKILRKNLSYLLGIKYEDTVIGEVFINGQSLGRVAVPKIECERSG
jgi:hypothetical protein